MAEPMWTFEGQGYSCITEVHALLHKRYWPTPVRLQGDCIYVEAQPRKLIRANMMTGVVE